MNNWLLIAFILVSLNSAGQTINYTDHKGDRPRGKFKTYISKDGGTYSVGDTIIMGQPSDSSDKYVYITTSDCEFESSEIAVNFDTTYTTVVLKRILVSKTRPSGWKVIAETKKGRKCGDIYFFDIEKAISHGEIKSKGMTSDQALAELKKAKDKLDLELITQEEYDKIEEDLKKYIK